MRVQYCWLLPVDGTYAVSGIEPSGRGARDAKRSRSQTGGLVVGVDGRVGEEAVGIARGHLLRDEKS